MLEAATRFARTHKDPLLALSLGVLGQAEIWSANLTSSEKLTVAPLALAGATALVWRRRAPVLTLAAITALFFASTAAVPVSGNDPLTAAVVLIVAVYSAGAHTSGRAAVTGGMLTLLVTVAAVADDPEDAGLGDYLFFLIVIGGPWVAGWAIRRHRLGERQMEQRAVSAELEQERRAREAVVAERERIARELHDVVAHAISVIVIQARGGRKSLTNQPEESRGAFDTIESTGRDALAEMRRLVGLLREGDDELPLAPQPGLNGLNRLTAQVTEAGLPVTVRVEGEPFELPTGIDLSAFRIVQEALTNALKHAGPATAEVVVRYGTSDLVIEVADTGSGSNGAESGGRGLVGMRERASLYGGNVEAGHRDEGGFSVRARLPLGP